MLVSWLTKPTEYTANLPLGKPEGIQSFPVGSELHPEGCCHRRQQARDGGGGRTQWHWCPSAVQHSLNWARRGRSLWHKGLWRHWGTLPTSSLPVAVPGGPETSRKGKKIYIKKVFLPLLPKHASFLYKEYYCDLKEGKVSASTSYFLSCMNSDTSMLVWHA